MAHLSANVGRHAELIAAAALIARGLEVSTPLTPESYDLSTRCPETGETHYYQVKSARQRDDRNGYIVVNARKGNGDIYRKEEVDYIIGVLDNSRVFILENRELKEYWINPTQLEAKSDVLSGDFRGGD